MNPLSETVSSLCNEKSDEEREPAEISLLGRKRYSNLRQKRNQMHETEKKCKKNSRMIDREVG